MNVNERRTLDMMIDWEQGDLDEEDTIELFQILIDNGMAWNLQGMYGRAAESLIENGLCNPRVYYTSGPRP